MKNHKYKIAEKDYERYLVVLPWSIILRGKSRKYIYSELEKRHPCFSQEWCFERKSWPGKKGLDSEVIVMNKFKLAEYKQRFPKHRLFLENTSGRFGNTVCGDSKTWKIRKNYFYGLNRQEINRKKIISGICLGLLLILIFGFVYRKLIVLNKSDSRIMEANESLSKVDPVVTSFTRNYSCEKFLNYVEKNNGRFDSLSWTSDGVTETFTASVSLLFPEQFENQDFSNAIEVSDVTYRDRFPVLSVTVKDNFENHNENLVYQNALDFVPENKKISLERVRRVFNDFHVDLLEERKGSLFFKFSCQAYMELSEENFLGVIRKIAEEENVGISVLKLQRIEKIKGNDGFSGEICFDLYMDFQQGIDPRPLAWRMNLIAEKNKDQKNEFITNVVTSVNKETVKVEKAIEIPDSRVQLGQIVHSDGSAVLFYRTKQGKIVKEEKKNEKK